MARFGVAKVFVQDSHRALATSRTLSINQIQHVRRTADKSEVLLNALADVHASIQRTPHHQYLVDTGTLGAKILRLAHRLLCGSNTAKKPQRFNNNNNNNGSRCSCNASMPYCSTTVYLLMTAPIDCSYLFSYFKKIIITRVQSNLAKGSIAYLSPLADAYRFVRS